MQEPVPIILFVIAITSVGCFGLMYFDKRSAEQGAWRVPERRILLWAFLGGALGAIAAQRKFRHKTRKEPFATLLKVALGFNCVAAVGLTIPAVRDPAYDGLKLFLNALN
jgi:uncharacterized membrane protein YsdA (DUF1294 family)